jgi:hypothetical protein
MSPCGVSYHASCFRVGPPFSTRLRRGGGLAFPKVQHWGTFICELCTVRAVIGRELNRPSDFDLLGLDGLLTWLMPGLVAPITSTNPS